MFEWFQFFLKGDHLKQVNTVETVCWDLLKGDRDCVLSVYFQVGHHWRPWLASQLEFLDSQLLKASSSIL